MNYKKIIPYILSLVILFSPLLIHAASDIVPSCNTGAIDMRPVKEGGTGQYLQPCDFTYVIKLVNNIITFLLFKIATPLVALIVTYAGFLILTSGGSSEKVTKGKHIFTNVIIGYVIALCAWLIVNTIMKTLGFTGPDLLH